MMLIDILENYVWFKSLMNNIKVDYTTLIRSLKTLEKKTSKNYRDILRSLNLAAIEKTGAAETIERVRDSILKIRRKRKGLIKELGERAII
jgi:hypothetical protein